MYIHDMLGTGARMYGGRWNSKGHPVIYTAGSRSLAALETLAHIPRQHFPADFCMALIAIPDSVSVQSLTSKKLPDGWQSQNQRVALQQLGDHWLMKGKEAVLRVPSVIIPEEWNVLINPLHPDMEKITLKKTFPFAFDERLQDSNQAAK